LDQLIKPAGGLEESVGQVKDEGRAISLLVAFQVGEEPTNVGEQQIADLRLLLDRRVDLGKRVL
jgi:hypothetical protein